MGGCKSQQKKLDDDLNRIKDAVTIPLKAKGGPNGELNVDARLSGTLQEFKEKVAAEFGVTKSCSKHVEMYLSGYQLEPATKIVREFTELCPVTCGWCAFQGDEWSVLGWVQETEIEVRGIEKAKEATKQQQKKQQAAWVARAALATCDWTVVAGECALGSNGWQTGRVGGGCGVCTKEDPRDLPHKKPRHTTPLGCTGGSRGCCQPPDQC